MKKDSKSVRESAAVLTSISDISTRTHGSSTFEWSRSDRHHRSIHGPLVHWIPGLLAGDPAGLLVARPVVVPLGVGRARSDALQRRSQLCCMGLVSVLYSVCQLDIVFASPRDYRVVIPASLHQVHIKHSIDARCHQQQQPLRISYRSELHPIRRPSPSPSCCHAALHHHDHVSSSWLRCYS